MCSRAVHVDQGRVVDVYVSAFYASAGEHSMRTLETNTGKCRFPDLLNKFHVRTLTPGTFAGNGIDMVVSYMAY